jgi:uncharacterized protein (DUF2141 family)
MLRLHRAVRPSARTLWAAALLCAATTGRLAGAPADATGSLHVRVVGLEAAAGEVALALFGSEDAFARGADAVATGRVEIVAGAAVWVVRDLPLGEYALKVYHDRNGNRELDKGKFGIPKEPYGFSNGARGRTGPPGFDKARFRLDEPSLELEVAVR